MISLAALLLSYCLFLVLRPQRINLAPEMQRTVKLNLTPAVIIAFIVFSIAVGVIAGFVPALFFSRLSAINALRNVSARNRPGGYRTGPPAGAGDAGAPDRAFRPSVLPAGAPVRYRSVNLFKQLTLRQALVVIQYTFTLIFITTTAIGYVQYKNILAFDLGFNTENILNIDMQGNKPDALLQELGEMPEVTALSRSLIITGFVFVAPGVGEEYFGCV